MTHADSADGVRSQGGAGLARGLASCCSALTGDADGSAGVLGLLCRSEFSLFVIHLVSPGEFKKYHSCQEAFCVQQKNLLKTEK